jgi:hypothetical protein
MPGDVTGDVGCDKEARRSSPRKMPVDIHVDACTLAGRCVAYMEVRDG